MKRFFQNVNLTYGLDATRKTAKQVNVLLENCVVLKLNFVR